MLIILTVFLGKHINVYLENDQLYIIIILKSTKICMTVPLQYQ